MKEITQNIKDLRLILNLTDSTEHLRATDLKRLHEKYAKDKCDPAISMFHEKNLNIIAEAIITKLEAYGDIPTQK